MGLVRLIVNNHSFDVDKLTLSENCEYFKALFSKYPTQNNFVLKSKDNVAFGLFLNYIFNGEATVDSVSLFEVYNLARLFRLNRLRCFEIEIIEFINKLCAKNIEHIFPLIEAAYALLPSPLSEGCFGFADRHASKILFHERFIGLSSNAVLNLISRNSFSCQEIDIFHAVCQWIEGNAENGTENAASILPKIRLSAISEGGLRDVLIYFQKKQCFGWDLQWLQQCPTLDNIVRNYRGLLIPFENVATKAYGARIIEGIHGHEGKKDGDDMINGEQETAKDKKTNYTRHFINHKSAIVVQLSQTYIIDYIRLRLWDLEENRFYKYYIETSVDKEIWDLVVDRRDEECKSWQTHRFVARPVTYIRITGTYNSVNNRFHVVHFECSYNRNAPEQQELYNNIENPLYVNIDEITEGIRIEDLVDIDCHHKSLAMNPSNSKYENYPIPQGDAPSKIIRPPITPTSPVPYGRDVYPLSVPMSSQNKINENQETTRDNEDFHIPKNQISHRLTKWRRLKSFFSNQSVFDI